MNGFAMHKKRTDEEVMEHWQRLINYHTGIDGRPHVKTEFQFRGKMYQGKKAK